MGMGSNLDPLLIHFSLSSLLKLCSCMVLPCKGQRCSLPSSCEEEGEKTSFVHMAYIFHIALPKILRSMTPTYMHRVYLVLVEQIEGYAGLVN